MGKIKVGTFLDADLWREFRTECVRRGLSTARELEKLIIAALKKWREGKMKLILLALVSAPLWGQCYTRHMDRVSVYTCIQTSVETAWTQKRAVSAEVTRYSETTESLIVRLQYRDIDGQSRIATQVLDVTPTVLQTQIHVKVVPVAVFEIVGIPTGISVEERQKPRGFDFGQD